VLVLRELTSRELEEEEKEELSAELRSCLRLDELFVDSASLQVDHQVSVSYPSVSSRTTQEQRRGHKPLRLSGQWIRAKEEEPSRFETLKVCFEIGTISAIRSRESSTNERKKASFRDEILQRDRLSNRERSPWAIVVECKGYVHKNENEMQIKIGYTHNSRENKR
jgi:serine phosphatase RsbU (regulator of sigma subunit)